MATVVFFQGSSSSWERVVGHRLTTYVSFLLLTGRRRFSTCSFWSSWDAIACPFLTCVGRRTREGDDLFPILPSISLSTGKRQSKIERLLWTGGVFPSKGSANTKRNKTTEPTTKKGRTGFVRATWKRQRRRQGKSFKSKPYLRKRFQRRRRRAPPIDRPSAQSQLYTRCQRGSILLYARL